MSAELIAHLVSELRPVRRLYGAAKRTALWLGIAGTCVAFGVCVVGMRADVLAKLRQPHFFAEELCLFTLSVFGANGAFRLSVPGLGNARAAKMLPLVAFGAWILSVAARVDPSASPSGTAFCWHCGWTMAILALIPALVSLAMLRRAMPLAAHWSGVLSLVSASALGMLGTQLLCGKDDALHVLVSHVVPVALTAALGVWFGARWSIRQLTESRSHRTPGRRFAPDRH